MDFLSKILELISTAGGYFSIFILIAFLYCKCDAFKRKSKYTMDDFALDIFGIQSKHSEDAVFTIMKWSFIIALISSVALIFFVEEYEDKIFLAIKLLSLTVSLIAILKR